MDPGEVIICIQYTAWLAVETENHTVVQFLAPGPAWLDSNCVSLEGMHSLEIMHVLPGAKHATFLAM